MSWWDRQVYKSLALAGSSNQGLVSTGAQTFVGAKTFTDDVTFNGNILGPTWTDWTPTYDAVGGDWSPTTQLARYLKIGRMVFFVLMNTAGAVSAISAYLSATLPFQVANTTGDNYPVTGFLEWNGTANRATTTAYCMDALSEVRIYTPDLTNFPAANARCILSGFYESIS